MLMYEAGDSIFNIAAFVTAALTNTGKFCQNIWVYHSRRPCITPVTHHQTMEILRGMTSLSPISQAKGMNSRPPKKDT